MFIYKTNHANNTYSEVVENNAGQVLRQTDHGNNDEKISVRYEYDSEGNKSKQINEDGSYIKYDYNEKNIITNESTYNTNDKITSLTSYSYDDKNSNILTKNEEKTKDEKTKTSLTTYTYDNNRLKTSTKSNPLSDESSLTSYSYDIVGNKVEEVCDGKTSSYTYNGLNQYK